MPFTWEALYSLLSPPALRDTSPSLFSSAFTLKSNETTHVEPKKTDLPMPPTSAYGAATAPSPAESSTSLAASERDYFPPTSPYTHRSPSMSSTSTASTIPHQIQRTKTTPATATTSTTGETKTDATPTSTSTEPSNRPAGPRRSATTIVAPEPLSRDFPKPAHEPSLDELLARPPGKWSLGHYVKHARPSKVALAAAAGGAAETRSEERARKFEETKRELLRAKEEMERLASTRR